MSYVIDEPSKHWLVIDENGRVIAIACAELLAHVMAESIGCRVEQARKGDWMVGDRLGVFHA